ncbi:macro domain-containing protein [Actinoplanes sp. DH11]|uniref:macro domain-containing protein n=1 Tax=Actinoplanes sp. DH11 TaxID=2857011 RepID=UPI001E4E769D|nr:macro domain-containing protein [Actinoplanes sp. DH11]
MVPATDPDRFRRASAALPTLNALGRTELIANGAVRPLPPKARAVLLRLATRADEPVATDLLHRDVWRDGRQVGRPERTEIQKRITLIRKAAGKSIIETITSGSGTAYRLCLGVDQIDFRRFRRMVEQAQRSDAATAVTLLEEAMFLWRGNPLQDVERLPFAGPVISELHRLHRLAECELLRASLAMGDDDKALAVSARCDAEVLREAGLAEAVSALKEKVRRRPREPLRRRIEGPPAFTVSVVAGDIFAHQDAHLVVGFTDTFDTDTRADRVINGRSLQAETTRRLFGGDRDLIDRRLRTALKDVKPAGRETRAGKRHGKLVRFPLGTVAPLRLGERLLFALAYSHMGNDLIARSSLSDLTSSLERLWEAVHLYGQLQPVAVPLMGSGLSRIPAATPTALAVAVINSFISHNTSTWMSTELRVVVRPQELAGIDLNEVADRLDLAVTSR